MSLSEMRAGFGSCGYISFLTTRINDFFESNKSIPKDGSEESETIPETGLTKQSSNKKCLSQNELFGIEMTSFNFTSAEDKKSLRFAMNNLNALAMCCQDSVNRNKIKKENGVCLLLKALKVSDFSTLHNRLLSSVVCFLYDHVSFHWKILYILKNIKRTVHCNMLSNLFMYFLESQSIYFTILIKSEEGVH